MFGYYIRLALLSLRRSAVLTALVITAIGVGIGASMTTLTVFRAMSGDPIPQKSHQLFVVQIDSRGPTKSGHQKEDTLETSLDYIDVMAWMNARRAKHQTALYATSLSVRPADPQQKPFKSYVRPVYTDFFPMFDVPFQYGNPWPAADDENQAPVVVISHAINDRLFGGADSVGKTIRLDGETYTVVGVLQEWGPTPRFYDLRSGHFGFGDNDEIFLPFTRAIGHHMPIEGSIDCTDDEKAGFANILTSDCIWLQFWVELPTAADAARYRAFLDGYAAEQRRIGRYAWPPQTRLRDVMQWLVYRQVVPNEVNILVFVSFGFLLVCLLNATGLMLAKLMGRAGDFGVRRALGASRGAIVCQCLIETGVVGLAGGALGLALTGLGLLAARSLLDREFAAVTHLDMADVGIAVLLAVGATLVAGVYPTWRAARVRPAWQLKAQ